MTWARWSSAGIAVAVVMIIISNAPAVLIDPLALAIAQMRVNAATTPPAIVTIQSSEVSTSESATSAKKVR